MVKDLNLIDNSSASFFLHTRQIEFIIGVQWRQENPNPSVHRFRLSCFPLERWTRELGLSCRHCISMVDYVFSHNITELFYECFLSWNMEVSEVN